MTRLSQYVLVFALLVAVALAWDAKIEAMLTAAYDASVVARGATALLPSVSASSLRSFSTALCSALLFTRAGKWAALAGALVIAIAYNREEIGSIRERVRDFLTSMLKERNSQYLEGDENHMTPKQISSEANTHARRVGEVRSDAALIYSSIVLRS